MMNHPERIDIAMAKAIEDGKQARICRYVELPNKDFMLECMTRTHRVNIALHAHRAYNEQNGGEKTK